MLALSRVLKFSAKNITLYTAFLLCFVCIIRQISMFYYFLFTPFIIIRPQNISYLISNVIGRYAVFVKLFKKAFPI